MKVKVLTLLVLLILLVGASLSAAAAQDDTVLSKELILTGLDFREGALQDAVATETGLSLAPDAVTGYYLSPVLEAPLAFNAVVPQWVAQVPETAGMSIQLRTGTGEGNWSNWFQIQENDDWTLPDDPDVVGQMVVVPAEDVTHQKAQLAIHFSRYDGVPAPVLEQLVLTFIDSTAGPSADELVSRQEKLDRQQPRAPEDGYPKPPVVSRAVWCTNPACNYSGLDYEPVTHLILHHTVSCSSTGDWAALMRAIWQFHTFTRGWGDIGYNYLVDPNGVLYEGHLGGDDVVGTHAAGANAGSMALSLMCDYTSVVPSQAMLNSAAALFAWKADQKKIDVFDAGRMPNLDWGVPKLMGHRDVYGTTACPGDKAHALLPWLRNEVAKRIGFVSPYVYVDEQSSAFSKSSSDYWYTAPSGCGFNGHAYYTWSTTNPANSTNSAEWRLPIGTSGAYQVQVYAPYCRTGRSETTGARYTITHSGGTSNVVANHDANVGTWMNLGTFNFSAGGNNVVRLTDLTTTDDGQGVWFDAIRLRPTTGCPTPIVSTGLPANGSWLKSRTVTFGWTVANGGCTSSTTLEVAADPAFSTSVAGFPKTFLGAPTSYTHTFDQDFAALYWRVTVTTTQNQKAASATSVLGIDTVAPASGLYEPVYRLEDGRLVLNWTGVDQGGGISGYNVDYRPQGQTNWTRWLTNVPNTTAALVPSGSIVYEFRSQAVDRAGNYESEHGTADLNSGSPLSVSRRILAPMVFTSH